METEKPVRVSLLGDQQMMLDVLGQLLQWSGMEVVVKARDAREFFSRIGREPADVVIIDLTLASLGVPDAQGVDAVREVHECFPELRPLVLSATCAEEMVESCYRNGAWAFLWKKNSSYETLLDTVHAVARGERRRSVDLVSLAPNAEPRPSADSPPLRTLTLRERQVLEYVAGGADNLKIAGCLGISERTAKAHVGKLYRKLKVETRAQMALLARRLGVRPPADA